MFRLLPKRGKASSLGLNGRKVSREGLEDGESSFDRNGRNVSIMDVPGGGLTDKEDWEGDPDGMTRDARGEVGDVGGTLLARENNFVAAGTNLPSAAVDVPVVVVLILGV